VIAITKCDLLVDEDVDPVQREVDLEIVAMMREAYAAIGIPLVLVSTVTGEGIEEVKKLMKDKSSVFSGQSGVGKSSLINAVTGLDIRVGSIVDKTKKGAHTTTTTNLIELTFGGWCVDTPGIKSFGVWDLEKSELDSYFTEIKSLGRGCKFPDCKHLHEEECAVKEALEKGELSPLRYESYESLLANIGSHHVRR
jgi:ribosome biogenesis GTPase